MSEKKKVYTVATSHLDTVWSWDFEETVSKYIYNTLVENFALFEKYPSYTFSFEGSYRYELMQEYYPKLFEKLQDYVKQGRWNVCGSAFENGDVNVPSPEALFRNILFGNSYFDKMFQKRSVDIYLPDCFGFGWALPSVAAHANLMGFTTQKLAWGSAYGVPFDIGRWQGVDGKSIYASINPHDYYFTLTKLRSWDFVLDKLKENEKYDLDMTYLFHGIGDRGGAPKEQTVKFVEEEIKKNGESDIEVISACADEIYRDLDKLPNDIKEKLPVWNNELVMKNHAVGGYTSRAIGKRWNRRCEELADLAERAGVISDYFGTLRYNKESLNRSWKRFIAHQFHDDIPGTSCQRVYRRSWNDYAMSMNQFSSELEASACALSSIMKTDFCEGVPVMVFNPVESKRTGAVTVRLDNPSKPFFRVFDSDGHEVLSQCAPTESGVEILFCADVKGVGTRVYDFRPSDRPCSLQSDVSVNSDNIIENEKYIVELNKRGDISSITDKLNGERELLKEPITLGLFNYTGSKDWPAWEMNFDEANKNADRTPKLESLTVLEQGPVRASLKVVQTDGKSKFTSIVSLTKSGDIVEVYNEIEWRSLRTMAKNIFSFTVSNENALFDLGLGAIKRGNMSEKLFEVPAQKWADITDEKNDFGVSVISECKYGWDKFNNNTLRLTVLHTPKRNYRIDSMQSMMDLGLNRYSYAILSHSGEAGAQTQLEARKFVTPMSAYVCKKHNGFLSDEYSFCSVSTNDVIIRAIKKAEDSDEIIVRLNEGTNKHIEDYKITLGEGIESAREIFASEEYKAPASVLNGFLTTSFEPYEIKSFALKLKKPEKTGVSNFSAPANLPYDKNIVSKQGENSDFEYSIPFEIMPMSITSNGVTFIFNKSRANALVTNGQSIKVPEGFNRLSLLCACLNGDRQVHFSVDDESVTKTVNSCFGRFAGWDLYDFGETAFIKKGKLGYEATHCHKNGKDEYAKGMYFYITDLDISNAKTVMLPIDSNVVIISASFVKDSAGHLVTPVYDEVEKRTFDFKMSAKEKLRYHWCKCVWMLGDKDNFISHNNNGKNGKRVECKKYKIANRTVENTGH